MAYEIGEIVFWLAVGLLAYVYVGYPVLVFLVSKIATKRVKRGDVEPTVTVLITAFNEEVSIARKIENTLGLEYPKDKLEILVASDGSTDRTDDIVREFEAQGVRLFRQEGRVGKTETQNNAVKRATGEIILFSDATTHYEPDVLRKVLPSFADETVGCVAGRLVYVDGVGTGVGSGAKGYWNYETFIKQSESNACSLIGASGCLYAVRREAYREMYREACSDFLICTVLYRQGLRSIFEPNAVCFEDTNSKTGDEMRMRVRVITQTFTDLWRNADMLNPLKSGFYAVQMFSHKLLRYAVPVMLIAIAISSLMLAFGSQFFSIILTLQVLFYLGALSGWLLERFGLRASLLVIPLYFVLANLASVIAFYRFIRGERFATWEPIRES
ncbi:MAG TPA: glycosyltransferase family 2 protein [Pyrinomonadaceae bacterium]|nr:glycosyltransferase family 2 protein [Pyrinomonadaceae bacterium]